ncbi:MAG TPA: DUF429 domain-containing protein [Pirellulales bacterium]|nr:DUF429 domain-containing protein [Pirellulales bacterium]
MPNAVGQRPVERLLASALMKGFKCGAHASNTSRTECYGPDAGIWKFIRLLESHEYRQEPMAIPRAAGGRYYFECYPHPAIIALLDLDYKLDYKVRKRNPAAWAELCDFLSALQNDAVLRVSNACEVVQQLRTQSKDNEDKVDSIVAAYLAAFFWQFGTDRSTVLGSLVDGYIVTPHSTKTKARFDKVFAGAINPRGSAIAHFPVAAGHSAPTPLQSRGREPMNALDAPEVGAEFDWEGTVELTASDTTNLWSNRNPWLPREKCERFDLLVRILDDEDEPLLRFVPFSSHGREQGGMAIGAGDTQRTIWRHLTSGARRHNLISYPALYRFIKHP